MPLIDFKGQIVYCGKFTVTFLLNVLLKSSLNLLHFLPSHIKENESKTEFKLYMSKSEKFEKIDFK